MLEKCKIGVLGSGNMGGALVSGWLASERFTPSLITAVDLRPSILEPLGLRGVHTSMDVQDGVRDKDVVVLGIKPQGAAQVLRDIGPHLTAHQVLVSIMAGVRTDQIELQLPAPIPVVRVMPQMFARMGAAASAMCKGQYVDEERAGLVYSLFEQVGSTVVVEEDQMDAVTGLSGSGPAYIYTVIEALADGGVRMGLARQVALKLAAQTVVGAGRAVLEEDGHPAILRDQITSPGGTTSAGLHKLEEKGLRDALISAVQAAAERASQLGAA